MNQTGRELRELEACRKALFRCRAILRRYHADNPCDEAREAIYEASQLLTSYKPTEEKKAGKWPVPGMDFYM